MFDVVGDPFVAPNGAVVPLSPAVIAGGFVFVSGQIAMHDGVIIGADIAEQTSIVLDQIEDLVLRAGSSLRHVVKTSIWLTKADDFAGFNAVYVKRFQQPWPARATVIIGLTMPEALIEIDAIAKLA